MNLFNVFVVLLTTVAIYKLSSNLISRFLLHKYFILKDIHLLSKSRPEHQKLPGTAIICGGSISGLLAARVCANHFRKVLIVEPEQWVVGEEGLEDHHRDPNPSKRSRVAQYIAYHHFQLIVTLTVKAMFSTFEQAIRSAGGSLTFRYNVVWVSGFPMLIPSGFPHYSRGVYPRVINMSRPAFETTLRRLVLQTCKEVQCIHGTVTGLLYDETFNRVSGVNVKLSNGKITELEGNLVIDATGPFLGGHRWLKALPNLSALNRSPSLEDIKITFDPKVRYTTSEFILPPKLDEDFRKYGLLTGEDVNCTAYAYLPRGGEDDKFFAMEKRERNFLHIVCGGYDWHGMIQSVGDIEEFMKELKVKKPLPEFMDEILHTLQSEDVPVSFFYAKFPLSVYIKYYEARHLPSNFVVVGDALTQTDPTLGQGCPKACATAIVLNSQLHRAVADSASSLPGTFAKGYFLEVRDRTEHIWINMKNINYNFRSTVPVPGENLQTTSRFIRVYGDIFTRLAAKDADISGAFYRQISWMDPATDMLAPWLVIRIAWAWIKQLFGYEIL